ncbi:MAG: hypothetical protein H7Z71_00730 [Moraxellaceae bacterium]|nr:hypothetical protein [Pseudobdellovibrionaceae bacterium]
MVSKAQSSLRTTRAQPRKFFHVLPPWTAGTDRKIIQAQLEGPQNT